MKLAIYTICKNEKKFLDKWIENVSPADYICVLDTGSTDGTWEALQEYAKQYPDKIIVKQKSYDFFRFDVARNDNLEMVPEDTDIYLSTDLDELLTSPNWVDEFKKAWIPGKTQRASYKYIWSHLEDGSAGRVFYYNKAHDKTWKWQYPVHELLRSTVTKSEHYNYNVSINLFDKVTLEHFPDRTKSRGSYLPLLELRAKEDPTDYYGKIYLGNEYVYRGMPEKALVQYDEILNNYADKYNNVEKASCYLFSGECYLKLNKKEEAISSFIKAINTDPTYREGYIALAKVLEDEKLWDMARSVCQEALKKTYRHFTWLERDTSWTYELYDLMSIACFYGGHKLDAIAYAAKALSICPNNERLKSNLDICLSKTQDCELATN